MAANFQQGLEDAGAFADEVLGQAQVDEEQHLLQGARPPPRPPPRTPLPGPCRGPFPHLPSRARARLFYGASLGHVPVMNCPAPWASSGAAEGGRGRCSEVGASGRRRETPLSAPRAARGAPGLPRS